MAPDSALSKRHIITAVLARLAHYARTAVRSGGIRYLARRTLEESRLQEIAAKIQDQSTLPLSARLKIMQWRPGLLHYRDLQDGFFRSQILLSQGGGAILT
jgi:hypothetical protein